MKKDSIEVSPGVRVPFILHPAYCATFHRDLNSAFDGWAPGYLYAQRNAERKRADSRRKPKAEAGRWLTVSRVWNVDANGKPTTPGNRLGRRQARALLHRSTRTKAPPQVRYDYTPEEAVAVALRRSVDAEDPMYVKAAQAARTMRNARKRLRQRKNTR